MGSPLSEAEQVDRIVERLRKDHPDPAMREKLYDAGKLPAYVRALMQDVDDEAMIERVIAAVRADEDGSNA